MQSRQNFFLKKKKKKKAGNKELTGLSDVLRNLKSKKSCAENGIGRMHSVS